MQEEHLLAIEASQSNFISFRVSSPKPAQPSRIEKDAFEDSQFDPVEHRHSARGWTHRTLFLSGLS
jgi:hypothetical protein